jgi:hypothetical protein
MAAKPNTVESGTPPVSAPARSVRVEDIVTELNQQLGDYSIAAMYRNTILSQRTRRYELVSRESQGSRYFIHSQGSKLRFGSRRLLCRTWRQLDIFQSSRD